MPAIASPRIEREDRRGRWSGKVSLTRRILAVNIFALAMLAGGFVYLDTYRSRLIDSRVREAAREVRLVATLLATAPEGARPALLAGVGQGTGARYRLYGADGARLADSWTGAAPTYRLSGGSERTAARVLDEVIDLIVFRRPLPAFAEPATDRGDAWREVLEAGGAVVPTSVRAAADGTPIVSAAAALPGGGPVLLSTASARTITDVVRAERLRLGIVIAIAFGASIALSLFLARTIVDPLRRLVRAAVRVRLGRAREVVVPRLPDRRDEIGTLARALSDMSQALTARIDATEAFAADVAHEIKNPLASIRSAVETLGVVEQPEQRAQLLAIVRDDVGRIDRLISDIAEASRLDAQLSRARFERVDLGALVEGAIAARAHMDGGDRIAFARPARDTAVVWGAPARLERVVDQLIDNALSFSPADGVVRVGTTAAEDWVIVTVEDEGPGVPAGQREAVFRRFHSERPEAEAFGRHSGLGLAIAKAIVEGHDGTITVEDRPDGRAGARFVVRLPLMEER